MPATRSNADYERRDKAVLRHVARYRVGIYAAVSQAVFEKAGAPIGHIAAKLEKRDPPLVMVHKRSINGGLNHITITKAGCRFLGDVPVNRGERFPAGAALDQAVGISFFCCLSGERRFRLEPGQLKRLLGDDAPADNVPHIGRFDDPCIYRIFQPSVETPQAIKRLKDLIEQAEGNDAIRPRLLQRDYGFAILAPTEAGRKSIATAVERTGLEESHSILIGLGPTAETLKAALKERSKKKPKPGKRKS